MSNCDLAIGIGFGFSVGFMILWLIIFIASVSDEGFFGLHYKNVSEECVAMEERRSGDIAPYYVKSKNATGFRYETIDRDSNKQQ